MHEFKEFHLKVETCGEYMYFLGYFRPAPLLAYINLAFARCCVANPLRSLCPLLPAMQSRQCTLAIASSPLHLGRLAPSTAFYSLCTFFPQSLPDN